VGGGRWALGAGRWALGGESTQPMRAATALKGNYGKEERRL
jgi:hypothetical protein